MEHGHEGPTTRRAETLRRRLLRTTALALVVSGMVATAALAAITPTRTASELSAAAVADPSSVSSSAFDVGTPPPNGNPVAVSTTALGSFPRHGASYGILSTGDATLATSPQSAFASADNGGAAVRGLTDVDVTVYRVVLNVPSNANCLSVDFRFLSEEYPSFVGGSFNDAFIAELDTSDWTTSASDISAPSNFAFDPAGQPISINATGATSMSEAQAAGTVYGGATPLLRASKQTTPGLHTLILSVFDQGDSDYDSAVFFDNIAYSNRPPSQCVAGALAVPPPTVADRDADGVPDSRDVCPTVSGTAGNGCPQASRIPLPSPVLGRRVNVEPVRGQVFVSLPTAAAGASQSVPGLKGRRFIPLSQARQVPTGSLLDTRRGTVRVTSARDARGAPQSGEFRSGVFQVLQSRKPSAKGMTELRLKGSSFRRCSRARRSSANALVSARRSRRTIRRLRGNARGRFRTRGRYSSATVRGTIWLTADRCDGTLTKVTRGKVAVRDIRRRRTIVLRAGKSHLARPR